MVNGDVLLDQPCNLHCLVRLDSVEGIMINVHAGKDDDQKGENNFTVEKNYDYAGYYDDNDIIIKSK